MRSSLLYLSPAEAARRLGVSAKALRLYEQRGLITPLRTAAGWRAYGPEQMARAGEIVALRALGLGLARISDVLGGDAQALEPALAAHQSALEGQVRQLAGAVDRIRDLRADLAPVIGPSAGPSLAFDLPWPWGGERFELRDIGPITFLTGPLGSGKTRLALRLAETLPSAVFLGLDRAADNAADPALAARVAEALAWLAEAGATACDALRVLLAALEAEGSTALVVDMPEQGLDQATQAALVAHLRRRGPEARPLFLLTRSSAILDLAAVRPGETILYCPANHGPPIRVAPYPGGSGYEAVASCLAAPDVRARTEGMVAVMSRAG